MFVLDIVIHRLVGPGSVSLSVELHDLGSAFCFFSE
jgi:hypothetical protein